MKTPNGSKLTIKLFWLLLKNAATDFFDDRGIKLSAALAYYTIFSITPLLLVLITTTGYFWGADAINGSLFGQIQGFVGKDAALQIQDALKNTVISQNSWIGNTLGVIALIFGATGVFVEIQDSINMIWGLKTKPKKGFVSLVLNRLISFSMILSIGFLLLVALIINSLMDIFSEKIQQLFPDLAFIVIYSFNIFLILFIISILFATIFKVLPDAKITWKTVLPGAIFTAILFLIGKWAIGFYLSNSQIGTAFGAAGSILIILVWIYYSAIILFYGAEVTQLYAQRFGKALEPNSYATFINTTKNPSLKNEMPISK